MAIVVGRKKSVCNGCSSSSSSSFLHLFFCGINGGGTGASGRMHLRFAEGQERPAPKFGLETTGPVRFVTQSPGGGGWGDPRERAPERVLRDLRDGIISEETARDVYGVAPSADGKSIDPGATTALREAL